MTPERKMRVHEVQRSRTHGFNRDERTTTWATVEDEHGNIEEVLVEQLLDLPTTYPLEPSCDGLSGDYRAWLEAQMHGPESARKYATSHSANYGNGQELDRYHLMHEALYTPAKLLGMLERPRGERPSLEERMDRNIERRRAARPAPVVVPEPPAEADELELWQDLNNPELDDALAQHEEQVRALLTASAAAPDELEPPASPFV